MIASGSHRWSGYLFYNDHDRNPAAVIESYRSRFDTARRAACADRPQANVAGTRGSHVGRERGDFPCAYVFRLRGPSDDGPAKFARSCGVHRKISFGHLGLVVDLWLLGAAFVLPVVCLWFGSLAREAFGNIHAFLVHRRVGLARRGVWCMWRAANRVAPMKIWWSLLRLAVALIWIYQGLWHKVIAVDDRHLEIVASAPSFLSPRLALGMIGGLETLFAISILARWKQKLFAYLQIGMLVAMNAAGILFAGDKIPDIGGMLTMNLVFSLTIWGLANHESRE